MEGLWVFLRDSKVLEALGLGFIILILFGAALWKIGVLEVKNPVKATASLIAGICPDPDCKGTLCEKLETLDSKVDTVTKDVSQLNGKLDIVVRWIEREHKR